MIAWCMLHSMLLASLCWIAAKKLSLKLMRLDVDEAVCSCEDGVLVIIVQRKRENRAIRPFCEILWSFEQNTQEVES